LLRNVQKINNIVGVLGEDIDTLDNTSNNDDDKNDVQSKTKFKKTPEDPERLSRTVFVGNIPVTLKKKVNNCNTIWFKNWYIIVGNDI